MSKIIISNRSKNVDSVSRQSSPNYLVLCPLSTVNELCLTTMLKICYLILLINNPACGCAKSVQDVIPNIHVNFCCLELSAFMPLVLWLIVMSLCETAGVKLPVH